MKFRSPEYRRKLTWLIVGVAVLVVGTAGYIFVLRPLQHPTPPEVPTAQGVAPTTPPVQVCEQLPDPGPSTPPDGAVEILTTDLADKVIAAHPEGSTFWFAPGTHHLSPGRYAQILPRNGDTFIGAPGAVLDGQRENRYAFGGQAANVTIKSLTIQNFGVRGTGVNEGVVNHDSAEGWTVNSNVIQHNAGAGAMIGSGSVLTGNCLRENGQYGFNAYHAGGVRDVLLEKNEITGNNTDDWEKRQAGCGCTGGGKFWETQNAKIIGNYVHNNHGVGLWADTNNTAFLFDGNYISDNASSGIFYEISYNAEIVNNTLIRNGLEAGPKNPGFPTAALYISESGSDPRVPGAYNKEFLVSNNRFIDNWSGVVGWENADRFAGSPANTSGGHPTLVNSDATLSRCADPARVDDKPLIDDCRWKTQNLLISHNLFETNPENIPRCARSTGCGFNGLFSNFGTYPKWSPYKGTAVGKNVTFHQNNRFRDNTYRGNWNFMAEEAGKILDWDSWRAAPYNQDADSTNR